MIEIFQFECLNDNYGFILRFSQTDKCVCIDSPDSSTIIEFAKSKGLRICEVWNTHWHPDHAGGNQEIADEFSAICLGPQEVKDHGFLIDKVLQPGDILDFDGESVEIIDLGGHTNGQIGYYIKSANIVFVGDALFALGCGRLFEGSPQKAHASLERLSNLPRETMVYCAHEYSQANARFCQSLKLSNEKLKTRIEEIDNLRAQNARTIPTSIGTELDTNPFMLADFENLSIEIGMAGKSKPEVFTAIRKLKDSF